MTKIMAVIHHVDDLTTLRNADLAVDAGFEGVFVIEMRGRDHLLDHAAPRVKSEYPHMIVGTNRLSVGPVAGIRQAYDHGLDAAWSDDPGLRSGSDGPIADIVDETLAGVRVRRPDFLFFGSVAFKTHNPDPDPERAAARAAARGWIVTTSGPQTGTPPPVEKLRIMRRGVGDGALAVASGVDPDNATEIAPLVDWILVATGISRDFHNFDMEKARRLKKACREAAIT